MPILLNKHYPTIKIYVKEYCAYIYAKILKLIKEDLKKNLRNLLN